MKLNLKQKIKKAIISTGLALSMLLSCNVGLVSGVMTFAKKHLASAVYSAKTELTYNFDTNSHFNNNTVGNSNNYTINRYQNLVDLKLANNRYPIVKYNGITTLSSERNKDGFDMSANNNVDDYVAVISTDDYQVARKYYLSDTDGKTKYNTVVGKDKTVNVIYVSQIRKTGESDADYNARTAKLKEAVLSLNSKLEYNKYVCIDRTADFYDSNDYSIIGTETEEYKSIATDLEGQTIDGEPFVQNGYNFYYKKLFEYRENYLYFRKTSTTSLTNNNYYVLSCWVYTSGNATATIAISGTNLDAKIENVKTDGVWTQYFLFIESRASVSTSVYIYLYYGDSNGVTGTKTLDEFKGTALSNGEENYKDTTLTGTVMFDNLKLTSINPADFVNQTINGHEPESIAKASIAKGYSIDGNPDKDGNPTKKIVNSSLAVVSGDGENKTTSYTDAVYNDFSQLYSVSTYRSARYYKNLPFGTDNDLNYGFNNSKDILSEDLVTLPSKLTYDSYDLLSANQMLTYYMPRYSDDKNSTLLTVSDQEAYRQKYANGMLQASIVPESEFGEYDRTVLDEFGNKVTEKDTDNNVKDKTEKATNNTFIYSKDQTNYVLKLDNKNSAYDLGVTTNSFTVDPMSCYRVSVWAYSNTKDAVATAKIFSTLKTKDHMELGQLVMSSQTVTDFEYNSNSTNGWKEMVFFICSNPYTSATVNLSLIASADDVVYFDNITVENVSSSSYSNGSYKLNLADVAVLTSNVSNGLFNSFSTSGEDATNTYPYTASNWTKDSSCSDEVISGIISTDDANYTKVVPAYKDGKLDYFKETETGTDYILDYAGKKIHTTTVKQMFGNQDAPVSTMYNQQLTKGNVYAVYMPKAEKEEDNPTFLIKSSNIGSSSGNTSLSANAVYKITFEVWIGDNFTGDLTAKLLYNNEPLTDIVINVKSDSKIKLQTWQTFTIYVRTGESSRTSISLQLGATKSSGTLFFQNVNNVGLSDKTVNGKTQTASEQFEELVKSHPTTSDQNTITSDKMSNIVRFVDMKNNNFTMHSTNVNQTTNVYDSYSYTLADKNKDDKYTQGVVGVVDPITGFKYQDVTINNILNSAHTTTNTYLLLKNEKDTDYTLATSRYNTPLSANKYYKIAFSVKTSDMAKNGLNISANGISEYFNNINTSSEQKNNGWSDYTIYVRTGSSSVSNFSLSFTLGKTKDSFKGWALVSDITINEIKEDDYKTETTSDEVKNNKNVIVKSLYVEQAPSTNDKTNTNNFSWTTFFLVFSSLLLVVALVIALVAVIIKKRGVKNTQTSGSSNNTDTSSGGIV